MADEHDRLYGAGTGFRFTTGPFHDSLERAVMARIRPELARRARTAQTAAAQASAQRRGQLARLEQTRTVLRDRMYACTNRELLRLARSNETATVLTEAAMTICRREVQIAIDASLEAWRAQGEVPANAREQLRDLVRQYVTTAAVRLRAALASAPAQQPAAPARASAAPGSSERQAVLQCIDAFRSGLRSNQLQDMEQLRRAVANLCRPEIESLGRAIFLANPSRPLDEGRSEAMVFAQDAIQRAQ